MSVKGGFRDTFTRNGFNGARSRSKTVSGGPSLKLNEGQPGPLLFRLRPITEGYLIHKKKRRYVLLDGECLFLFKNTRDFKEPPTKIALHLSAVRPTTSKDIPGFDIITSAETFSFHADKEPPTPPIAFWIEKIQEVCNTLVLNRIGGSKENILTKSYSKLISKNDIEGNIIEADSEYHFSIPQKKAIKIAMRAGNRICADCKAPGPEWASVNLGMFICIDCSGIHRSFGSHISKVRSVKLDNWDDELIQEIEKIGNIKGNEYWEYQIPPEFSRPETFAPLKYRKEWLALKYVEKRFTQEWKEKIDSPSTSRNTRQEIQEKQLQEIKNEAENIRKTEYKSTILRLLQEDPMFLQEMRLLLLQDIDLDELKLQILQLKASEIGEDLIPIPSTTEPEETKKEKPAPQ